MRLRAWIQHFAGKVGDGVLLFLFYFILFYIFFFLGGGMGEGGGLGGGGIKQESKETAECMHTYQNLLMTFPNATNI